MLTRNRQLGYWHLLGALVSVLVALDVWFTLTGTFRRRRITDESGSVSFEPTPMYWRRVARSAGRHIIIVWMLLIGCFWAIIHFGPLRPVHE